MNTSLNKALAEAVIAELGKLSVHLQKQAVYLQFIFNCCARHQIHTKISGEYVIEKRVSRYIKISVIKKQSTFGP